MIILHSLRNAGAVASARVRGSRARTVAATLTAAACGALLIASTHADAQSYAQQPMPSGPHSPENRAAAADAAPNPSGSTVHESNAPQSKDAKGTKKGATAGSKSKPEGAGGFDNGLYGTGSGSNK
jgi:hypothetical protein